MNRPEILSAPNIPKPLHGLNPRTIMGREAWDDLRRSVYAKANFCCVACGVHKSQAKKHRWLEAHEVFDIDYKSGTAELVEIVGLCHYCHAFIHSGLTRVRARKKEISSGEVRSIMGHGVRLLRQSGTGMFVGTADLCDIVSVDRSGVKLLPVPREMAPWGKWRMIWDGVEYQPKFKSMRDWERQFAT